MKYILSILSLFTIRVSAQDIDMDNDTILLKEIHIDADKPAKLKTVRLGKGKGGGFVSKSPEYIYLIEDIPEGIVQEIIIHFNYFYANSDKKIKKKTVDKTEFEITIYDVGNDNMLGQKINLEPFIITLEESNDFYPTRSIDLSAYNFYSKRFFIVSKRISPLPCEDCYYYLPALNRVNRKLFFHGDKNTVRVSDNLQGIESDEKLNYSLRCEVKTLTRDY